MCTKKSVYKGKILVCPENFFYVREKYGIIGKISWYVRKIFFGDLSPPPRNIN